MSEYNDHALQVECRSLAASILEDTQPLGEIEAHDSDLNDLVHEYVDGHQYVIYHYQALKFCAECDVSNGEQWLEDVGLPHEVSLNTLASSILYGEMVYRVQQELEELVEEHNERLEAASHE